MWPRVARDSVIVVGGAAALAALQVAFRAVAIGSVPVATYGRAAFLLSIFNAVAVVGHFGISASAARLSARSHGRARDRDTLHGLAVAAAGPVVGASLLMVIAGWAVTKSLPLAIVGGLGLPPLAIANYCMGFIRGKGWIWTASSIQPANLAAQLGIFVGLVAAGVHVGVGWIVGSFYLGNVAALVLGALYLFFCVRQQPATDDPADPDATPRRILGFAAWLAVANAAVLMLAVQPRVSLARVSYSELAYFDLALLMYTIPQRLKASFLVALIPHASAEHKRGSVMTVPSYLDLALLTALVGLLDLVLWRTHVIRHIFVLLHMRGYIGAEPLFLIVLLAAPAEIFYGLTSGLLQALGQSKRLGIAALCVLVATAAVSQLGYFFGPYYLASILAGSYWVLCMTTRRLLAPAGVQEMHVFRELAHRLVRDRWRHVVATVPEPGE